MNSKLRLKFFVFYFIPENPTGQGFGGLQYAGNTASVFTSFLFDTLPSGFKFCLPSPAPPESNF